MPVNIQELSKRELDELIKKANARKTKLKRRKSPATVRRKVDGLLREEGYTFEELFGSTASAPRATRKAVKKAGRKVPPKYRNPANKDEVWSGRGRRPRWFAELVDKGTDPEKLLIKK